MRLALFCLTLGLALSSAPAAPATKIGGSAMPCGGYGLRVNQPEAASARKRIEAGLEEMNFPEPEPVPAGEPALERIPVEVGGGAQPFPPGEGWTLTTFVPEGGIHSVVFDQVLPVPPLLRTSEGHQRFGALLDGRWLGGSDVDPGLRAELIQWIASQGRPSSFQTLHVQYRPTGPGGRPGKEERVGTLPIHVKLERGMAIRVAEADSLKVQFEGRLKAQKVSDYGFSGVVTYSDGRKVRLEKGGWVRNLDLSHLDPASRPRAVWRGPLSNGEEVQVVLLPRGSRVVWREPGGNRGSLIDRILTRALEEVKRHPHVTVRADVGRRAGASGFGNDVEMVFTHDLPGLFPLGDAQGPTEWIRSSPEEVWTGLQRRYRRAAFILKGRKEKPRALAEEANRVVEFLNQRGYPDYNVSAVVSQDEEQIRLFIAPRHPQNNRDAGIVVADQDYWIVKGQHRFMGLGDLERFGLAADVFTGGERRPLLRGQPRDPVLAIPLDALAQQGVLFTSDPGIFYDPHLRARVELASRLQGVPLEDSKIQEVKRLLSEGSREDPQEVSRREVVDLLGQVTASTHTPGELITFIERLQQWDSRHLEAFRSLGPEAQNTFTRHLFQQITQLGQGSDLVQVRTIQPSIRGRDLFTMPRDGDSDLYLDFDGGTEDVVVNVAAGRDGVKRLSVGLMEGGPANQVVRALRSLAVRASVLTLLEPSRVSFFILRSGRRELRLVPEAERPIDLEAATSLWQRLPAAPVEARRPKPTLWVGQRMSGPQEEFARHLADRLRQAQAQGYPVNLFVHESWTRETLRTILSARPQRVFTAYQAFARRLARKDPEWFREQLEWVASRADALRLHYGVQEWLVYLETGGLILVNDQGWWHVLPSSLDRLTYTSGAAGGTFATYGAALSRGFSPPEAALWAMRFSAFFMSREASEWGTPAGPEQLEQVHGPEIRPLPIPRHWVKRRREYERQQAAEIDRRMDEASRDRVANYLEEFPEGQPEFGAYVPWLTGLDRLRVDLDTALSGGTGLPELRREIVNTLVRIPLPDRPAPSYRLVRTLLGQAALDEDPVVRQTARAFWIEHERQAWGQLVEALQASRGEKFRVEYDPAWMQPEASHPIGSRQVDDIQQELQRRLGIAVELVAFGDRPEPAPEVRQVTLVAPPTQKIGIENWKDPADLVPLDEHGLPSPEQPWPLRRQSYFPGERRDEAEETLPEPVAEDVSQRLRGRRVLGMFWGGSPHPENPPDPGDTLLWNRAFLLALTVASLPQSFEETDPRFVALRRYMEVMGGKTLTRQDLTELLSEAQGDAELAQKEAAVRRAALNLSSASFQALLPEKPDLKELLGSLGIPASVLNQAGLEQLKEDLAHRGSA